MAWIDGFVIEYAPKERKGNSCRDCIHANMEDKSCSKRPIVFREDGYGNWKTCKYFNVGMPAKKEDKQATTAKQDYKPLYPITSRTAEKPRAVITKTEKKKTVNRDAINRNRIIGAKKQNLLDDESRLFADIESSNFIKLQDSPKAKKICSCGGSLVVSQNNEVYFHIHDALAFVHVKALVCTECKRLYVLKEKVIKSIKGIQ